MWSRISPGSRPASSQRPAGLVRFTVAGDTTAALKRLASAHDGTLHTTLLAIFQSLLHRYTTQAEVIVGTPTLGRHRPEFAGVVGCFVNTLPIRTRFDDGPSFLELHARVRRDVRDTTTTVTWSADAADADAVRALPLTGRHGELLGILMLASSRREIIELDHRILNVTLLVGAGGVLLGFLLSTWFAARINNTPNSTDVQIMGKPMIGMVEVCSDHDDVYRVCL